MKKMKKLLSALLITVLTLTTLPATALAANYYTINGVSVSKNTGRSLYNCASYASEIQKKIWGSHKGTTVFNSSYNMLKNKSSSERKITEDHVRNYIQAAPLGSRIRICYSSDTTSNNNDNNTFGHTMILVAKDNAAGTFTTLEAGGGVAEENTYTYKSFTNRWTNHKKTAKGMTVPGYLYFFYIADLSCFKRPDGDILINTDITLRNGSSGTQVKYLQTNLNALGYNCGTVDGAYGNNTKNAVIRFQKEMGLSADGIAGPKTLSKMVSVTTDIQKKLNSLGYNCGTVNGVLGNSTINALKQYERDKNTTSTNNNIIPNAVYELTPKCAPAMRLDITSGSINDGANAQLYESNKTPAQRFEIKHIGNGYYTIIATVSAKVLEVEPGDNVRQYAYYGRDEQIWKLEDAGNGYYYIISAANPNKCLDVAGAGTTNGTNVQVFEKNHTDAQKWKLTKAY